MIQGFTSLNFSMKSSRSTTRSRITGKFASGSIAIGSPVVGEEGGAGELRLAVHHHAAAAAHGHAARPAVRERAVDLVLDVVQRVEDLPVRPARDLVGLLRGCTLPCPGSKRVMSDRAVLLRSACGQ